MILKEAMKAKEYAGKAHEGQVRRFSGKPYVSHPNNVASIVKRFKNSHKIDQLVSAALLHDTIEDTETTAEDLHKLFGGLVASLVKELTSDEEEISKEGKTKYLANKMKSMSSWALVIKLADRLDNVSDLKTASSVFAERYGGQTRKLLKILEAERKLTNTQEKLVKAIKDKLDELDERDIDEEWKMTVKGDDPKETIEIFVNPTKKELLSIRNVYVRFIIDLKNEKFYAWNADYLHVMAAEDLDIPYADEINYAFGTSFSKRNGLLVINNIDNRDITLRKKITSGNHWSSKYFTDNKKFNEGFETNLKGTWKDDKNKTYEVFVNPTKKEIGIFDPELRFLIDEKQKKFYIFSSDLLHVDVAKVIKNLSERKYQTRGFAIINKKTKVLSLDYLSGVGTASGRSALLIGRHWASKWFDIEED